MASWKEERDRLVAQTLAFVQQVAAATPVAGRKIGTGSTEPSASSDAPLLQMQSNIALQDTAIEPDTEIGADAIAPPRLPAWQRVVDALPARSLQYSSASARAEISDRVATFKQRQLMLNREREAYYDLVQARIRSALRSQSDADML